MTYFFDPRQDLSIGDVLATDVGSLIVDYQDGSGDFWAIDNDGEDYRVSDINVFSVN